MHKTYSIIPCCCLGTNITDQSMKWLWVELYALANFTDTEDLRRGQLRTTYTELSLRSGITEKQVRTRIDKLLNMRAVHHNIHNVVKTKVNMKLTFNKDVIRFLCGEARHKFTRCEAFGFLYAMIAESKDKAYSVSCNLLAKEWRWDNHVVKDFLDELALAGILEIQRSTKIMTLSFTEKFREMAKEMQPLFSLLALTNRKASMIEAFFYVIQEVASQDHRAGDSISFRSIAKKLGWSHHTVVSLLSYMKENNIIIQSPADDSRMLKLGWA